MRVSCADLARAVEEAGVSKPGKPEPESSTLAFVDTMRSFSASAASQMKAVEESVQALQSESKLTATYLGEEDTSSVLTDACELMDALARAAQQIRQRKTDGDAAGGLLKSPKLEK